MGRRWGGENTGYSLIRTRLGGGSGNIWTKTTNYQPLCKAADGDKENTISHIKLTRKRWNINIICKLTGKTHATTSQGKGKT